MNAMTRIMMLPTLLAFVGCTTIAPVGFLTESGTNDFPKGKTYVLVEDDVKLFIPQLAALTKEKMPKALVSRGVESTLLTEGNYDAYRQDIAYLMRIKILTPDFEDNAHALLVSISLRDVEIYNLGFVVNPNAIDSVAGWDEASDLLIDVVVSKIFDE